MFVSTVGLDIAKNVFRIHGIDEGGKVVVRRQLRRGQVLKDLAKLPPCLIGMEACATAHHWARELRKLGYEVRLMPARYVKPYVKRNKNDAADAEAICEAVTRPNAATWHQQARWSLFAHPFDPWSAGRTRQGRYARLSGSYLAGSRPAFAATLTAIALNESRLQRIEACT